MTLYAKIRKKAKPMQADMNAPCRRLCLLIYLHIHFLIYLLTYKWLHNRV